MSIALLVATLSALGTAVTVLIGAQANGKRSLTGLENTALLLCAAGLVSTVYQNWDDSRKSDLTTYLKLAWEAEQDATIQRARISIIFPSGTTTERAIANHLTNMSFYMASSSTKSTGISLRYSEISDVWQVKIGGNKLQKVGKVIYGLPLLQDQQRFCWWSEAWGAPERITIKRKEITYEDRALCALSIELPVDQLPIHRIRELASLQSLGINLGHGDEQMLCSGTCNDAIVALILYTNKNRYDVSPFQRHDKGITGSPGKGAISASGAGILAQLQILFQDREGVSSREGQELKMGLVDKATRGSDTVMVLGGFEIFPSVPPNIESYRDFLSRFAPNTELFISETWCGFASKPEFCNVSMVAVSPSEAPKN